MRGQMCSVGVMLMMGMLIGCGDDKGGEAKPFKKAPRCRHCFARKNYLKDQDHC